jgi:hypothetical protein
MKINNAVTKYQAFYMVRIPDDSNQFAKNARAAATAEYEGGNRHYEDARQLFRRLN